MSYRITIDGEPFCSSNFEHSQLLNPKVTLEVNKSGSLTFTMMPDHPYYNGITFRQNIFDVYLNDELIFEGIPVSDQVDFWNRRTVVCEGELTFLNDTIQRQAVYQNQTVASLLGEYLTVHNAQADATKQFTVGRSRSADRTIRITFMSVLHRSEQSRITAALPESGSRLSPSLSRGLRNSWSRTASRSPAQQLIL